MADRVEAWHPDVPLVSEVLHARFEQHSYPAHTHGDWAVLLIDSGAVVYDLGHATHHAEPSALTILPPHVPHDGRSAIAGTAFRKRVLYLDADWLPASAVDAAVHSPALGDPRALRVVRGVHEALRNPGDAMAAEGGVLALADIVRDRFGSPSGSARDTPLARRLRVLLDDRLTESFTIAEAARILGAHPSHLVRAFSRAYGIAPHRYVTGRRVDRARRLLLGGLSPAETAVAVGFHDQAHLTRHFRRTLGTTPAAFAA
ncbi:helix-turn-helix transcriptional regulator [Microbacterium sediminis]|uniref:AraC family transcriptional regulator n=1 Tax=Microbacterium sediminis TaxID=904291 RepID=A0A1B9NDT8_9MICO|nr:AraC family transcriptional regulator [Microbacterium sediminis]OCG74766.1 AraC family transcriptional regulator [Microbacterium sediminis]QBR75068.1 AraC family transcriptional regulator [Microbacterium sediminis]